MANSVAWTATGVSPPSCGSEKIRWGVNRTKRTIGIMRSAFVTVTFVTYFKII